MSLKILVEFTSDWAIGMGAGIPGSTDRLVIRDEGGLPYVPAKTLTGILRDGCELVADVLDQGQSRGAWSNVLASLFGEQNPEYDKKRDADGATKAKLSIRPARFPGKVAKALTGKSGKELRRTLTFVAPHVEIDKSTGRSKKDHLFLMEKVRAGALLESTVSINGPALTDAESALLFSGARAVRRIGGKRRRGDGECRIEIKDAESKGQNKIDTWLDWLERNDTDITCKPYKPIEQVKGEKTLGQDGEWATIPYTIRPQSPLAIGSRAIGNVVETLDYIPGTMLLPLIHGAMASVGIDAASGIEKGDIIVTCAYPARGDGGAWAPVPHALFAPKDEEGLKTPSGRVFNLLKRTPLDNDAQLKAIRTGYVRSDVAAGVRPDSCTAEKTTHTHNTVDDEPQRPTENVGGVYTYEALKQETIFRGELRIRGMEKDKSAMIEQLNKDGRQYSVGISKKDDYGQVEVGFSEPIDEEGGETRKFGDTITVWLLSDVLLRDGLLGMATRPDQLAEALSNELGVTLEIKNGKLPTAFCRARRSEGWITKWGLPRPSLVGLCGGSCFIFKVVDGNLDKDRVTKIETSGIGHRKAEGFGQLRIDPALLTTEEISTTGEEGDNDPPADFNIPLQDENDPSHDFLRQVETELWKDRIRKAALNYAYEDKPLGFTKKKPSNSQAGTIRMKFGAFNGSEPIKVAILQWIQHAESIRRDDWPVGTGTFLTELVNDNEKVWSTLFGTTGLALPTATEGGPGTLKDALWDFAVRTLVTTVCSVTFDIRGSL